MQRHANNLVVLGISPSAYARASALIGSKGRYALPLRWSLEHLYFCPRGFGLLARAEAVCTESLMEGLDGTCQELGQYQRWRRGSASSSGAWSGSGGRRSSRLHAGGSCSTGWSAPGTRWSRTRCGSSSRPWSASSGGCTSSCSAPAWRKARP